MISNALTILGLKAEASADAQFTKDAESKAMAFDLYGEDLEKDFRAMADAISQAEVAVQGKRDLRDTAKKNRGETETALNGTLTAYEAAKARFDAAKTDEARNKAKKEMDDAERDGTQFQNDLATLTARITELDAEIEGHEGKLDELLEQLEAIQKEIANLPAEKAQAVSEHIANTKLAEAYERAMGLRKTANRRPIDAVREDNKQLAARTKVAGKIAGVDADKKRAGYIEAGRKDQAGADFQKLLHARKAERDTATGAAQVETEERPKI
jgi:chromosome segregation ATPase